MVKMQKEVVIEKIQLQQTAVQFIISLYILVIGNKERRVAYEIQKEEERRKQLGFNENNPWSIEKEIELKLFTACQTGNINAVNKLLENNKNININQPQQNGSTFLFTACKQGHLDIVKRLLLVQGIEIQHLKMKNPYY